MAQEIVLFSLFVNIPLADAYLRMSLSVNIWRSQFRCFKMYTCLALRCHFDRIKHPLRTLALALFALVNKLSNSCNLLRFTSKSLTMIDHDSIESPSNGHHNFGYLKDHESQTSSISEAPDVNNNDRSNSLNSSNSLLPSKLSLKTKFFYSLGHMWVFYRLICIVIDTTITITFLVTTIWLSPFGFPTPCSSSSTVLVALSEEHSFCLARLQTPLLRPLLAMNPTRQAHSGFVPSMAKERHGIYLVSRYIGRQSVDLLFFVT